MWCVEEVYSKRVHVERSSGQTPIPVPTTCQTGLTTSLPPLLLNRISLFLSFFSSQVEERVMVLKDICRDPNALGKLEISNFEFFLKWHKNGLVTALLWGTILEKIFQSFPSTGRFLTPPFPHSPLHSPHSLHSPHHHQVHSPSLSWSRQRGEGGGEGGRSRSQLGRQEPLPQPCERDVKSVCCVLLAGLSPFQSTRPARMEPGPDVKALVDLLAEFQLDPAPTFIQFPGFFKATCMSLSLIPIPHSSFFNSHISRRPCCLTADCTDRTTTLPGLWSRADPPVLHSRPTGMD